MFLPKSQIMTLFSLLRLVSAKGGCTHRNKELQTSGISSKPINQGWILEEANEAVALGSFFQRYRGAS